MRATLLILLTISCSAGAAAADTLSPPREVTLSVAPLWAQYPEAAPLAKAVHHRKASRRLARRLALDAKAHPWARTWAWWLLLKRAERRRDAGAQSRALEALQSAGPLRLWATQQLIEEALAKGGLSRALKLLALVPEAHPRHAVTHLRRLSLALDAGALRRAEATAAQITIGDLPAAQRAEYWFYLGELHRLRGDLHASLRAYQRSWRRHHPRWSAQASQRLLSLGRPTTTLERLHQTIAERPRGRAARRAGAWSRWCERAREQASLEPGLLPYVNGRIAQLRRATRSRAIEHYRAAITESQDAQLSAHARYHLGDLLGRLNRDQEAIAVLEPALALDVDEDWRATLRYRLHRLYKANKRWLDAERQLRMIVASSARGEPFRAALWRLAWRRLQSGDLNDADRLMARLEPHLGSAMTPSRQPWLARLRYWRARIAGRRGDKAAAQRGYAEVERRWPLSWYGWNAADRLEDSNRNGRQPEKWPLWLQSAVFFLQIERVDLAIAQLERLRPHGLSEGGVQLLASLYQRTGATRRAVWLLRRATSHAQHPGKPLQAPWRKVFPIPWRKMFATSAASAGISKSLLYAVTRQESSFVPHAVSGAGAVGLTQLLPHVARKIARLYRRRPPTRRGLKRPATNVPLGAYYLGELSRMYHGNCALVTAAYNAGPYAVRRWLRRFGVVETDAFLESIPYRGAARYAMGVCAATATYATLYPDWSESLRVTLGRGRSVPPVSELGAFMTGPQRTSDTSLPLDRSVALR